MENSKEFVEFNFKVNFTGDDNEPLKAQLDIPFDKKESSEETKAITPDIDIYDQTAIYVAPMYIIHTRSFRSLTLKISLTDFITHGVDACRTQLSLLNRQFNKLLFLKNLKVLLHNRKLNLSAISKIFMKIQCLLIFKRLNLIVLL